MSRRELILAVLESLTDRFLVQDRENDPELPSGAIEDAVAHLEVTISELAFRFEELLRAGIPVWTGPGESGQAAVHSRHSQLAEHVSQLREKAEQAGAAGAGTGIG